LREGGMEAERERETERDRERETERDRQREREMKKGKDEDRRYRGLVTDRSLQEMTCGMREFFFKK